MNNHTNKIEYCLGCIKKPCQKGCPLDNDITGFIKHLKDNNIESAYNLLTETTVLSSICGRICPHDKQCQGSCIRGLKGTPVDIGYLESYIGDMAIKNNWSIKKISNTKKKEKIAIIGSGPSSLTCAAYLARNGYNVTIYEKYDSLGGILYHSIPKFRLDKDILKSTINKIILLGINYHLNKELGKNIFLEDLEKEYDCIYLGLGANKTLCLNIEGEDKIGVFSGNELLETNNHPPYKNKIVAVYGGGNVAMDISRTINKLGAKKVIVIYRRSEKEMPAEIKEIIAAKKEGVEFVFQTNIIEILGKEKIKELACLKTELIKDEGENRLIPKNIKGSNHTIKCDYLIKAIGTTPDINLLKSLKLELTKNNYLKVNKNSQTSKENIFAGGDLAGNNKTVAFASKSGRDAAANIIKYLETKGE